MSIIKDFRRKNEIDIKASSLVNECFTDLVLKKIEKLDEKKARKKTESKVKELKFIADKYVVDKKLGIYGKARLIREIQNQLQHLHFEKDFIDAISGDFLTEPLRK